MGGEKVYTFGELIDSKVLFVSDGYRAKNDELGGYGPIFLRAGHVSDHFIDFNGVERFQATLSSRLDGKMSRPGDVIVTTKGNSIGRVAYVTDDMPSFVYSPHLSFWRSLESSFLIPGFLRYWSQSDEFRGQLAGLAGSTDMAPYLSLMDQRRLRITLPNARDQLAIARILGDLDNYIYLIRRMNHTLEAMVRAIFKSRFVNFDQSPEGWRDATLGDLAHNPRRGIDPSEIPPETPYIGLEHMPRKSMVLGEWGIAKGLESGKFSFHRGEILFGKLRPYFHKVGVAPVAGVCSTDILVVVPKSDAYFGVVLGIVTSDDFVQYTDRTSAGTKMPRTNWSDMARYEIVVPPESVARAFTRMIMPMVEKIISNVHESRSLAAIRDALLPNPAEPEPNK